MYGLFIDENQCLPFDEKGRAHAAAGKHIGMPLCVANPMRRIRDADANNYKDEMDSFRLAKRMKKPTTLVVSRPPLWRVSSSQLRSKPRQQLSNDANHF